MRFFRTSFQKNHEAIFFWIFFNENVAEDFAQLLAEQKFFVSLFSFEKN